MWLSTRPPTAHYESPLATGRATSFTRQCGSNMFMFLKGRVGVLELTASGHHWSPGPA